MLNIVFYIIFFTILVYITYIFSCFYNIEHFNFSCNNKCSPNLDINNQLNNIDNSLDLIKLDLESVYSEYGDEKELMKQQTKNIKISKKIKNKSISQHKTEKQNILVNNNHESTGLTKQELHDIINKKKPLPNKKRDTKKMMAKKINYLDNNKPKCSGKETAKSSQNTIQSNNAKCKFLKPNCTLSDGILNKSEKYGRGKNKKLWKKHSGPYFTKLCQQYNGTPYNPMGLYPSERMHLHSTSKKAPATLKKGLKQNSIMNNDC